MAADGGGVTGLGAGSPDRDRGKFYTLELLLLNSLDSAV
jgi:hypothetical protein